MLSSLPPCVEVLEVAVDLYAATWPIAGFVQSVDWVSFERAVGHCPRIQDVALGICHPHFAADAEPAVSETVTRELMACFSTSFRAKLRVCVYQ